MSHSEIPITRNEALYCFIYKRPVIVFKDGSYRSATIESYANLWDRLQPDKYVCHVGIGSETFRSRLSDIYPSKVSLAAPTYCPETFWSKLSGKSHRWIEYFYQSNRGELYVRICNNCKKKEIYDEDLGIWTELYGYILTSSQLKARKVLFIITYPLYVTIQKQ